MPLSEKLIRGVLIALPTLMLLIVVIVFALLAAGGSVQGSAPKATVVPSAQASSISVNCGPDGAQQKRVSITIKGHPIAVCAPGQAGATPAAGQGGH